MLLKQSAPLRMIVLSPAKRPRIAPDKHIRTIVGPSSLSVEDELAQAKIAWKRYQSTRERDAIYDYLRAVFNPCSYFRRATVGARPRCLSRHSSVQNHDELFQD
jgi:hypothetical protein